MDVVKVFVEEPTGLEVVAADADPDARRRGAGLGSLDALLGRPAPPYARAYLAGTDLSAAPPRVGLTALAEPSAWLSPLLAWAGDRPWTHLGADGRGGAVSADEAAAALRAPAGALALALGDVPLDALAEAAAGGAGGVERREALHALRRVLAAEGGAALFPEPAHDGWDWSVFARRPLDGPLREAFARHPAPPGVRRFVAPYRRARGEHTFYFEQWALDPPPEWAEAV
ncbi:hypothetical protein RQM47_05185 [Rubrivirga sp. S365]|uniref:Uncharacterized protein n=1 Tax=Rubrivirga litoralis TaxID=3075598 RepID=A0ABU3BPR2_9BACT|nr:MULTISPECIES: hypothetical protein [unclassified Rubrivirga]MDT0631269.1 hypothetical protein [Rubrivirga sp. F394]MDT7856027.1 hypothetical protein [Rubrivirga sp. S365]